MAAQPDNSLRSQIYFIADLHLDPSQPRPFQLALDFLSQIQHAKALYILGDLFEYWIGDDAGIPFYQEFVDALSALSASGCQVSIMLGNRDFLLGEVFAQSVSARLIKEDELMITLDDAPVLLMHGDTLCTDDVEYQKFRQHVRDPQWQQTFLAKSIDERIAYATYLREQSREMSAGKTHELMDVNHSQVQSRLAVQQCRTLIHGHTHRPDVHVDQVSGDTRLVVGDWHPEYACYAVNDATGLHLKRFDGQLDTA